MWGLGTGDFQHNPSDPIVCKSHRGTESSPQTNPSVFIQLTSPVPGCCLLGHSVKIYREFWYDETKQQQKQSTFKEI
jgi:hypothetical protein